MKSRTAIDGILMSFSFVSLLLTGFGGTAIGKSPVDDVAIKGYDTVAYFKAGKALKGNESFTPLEKAADSCRWYVSFLRLWFKTTILYR
jgi:hypothetical protein